MSANLLKAIAVTAELTGTDMSEGAAAVFAADLADYPERQVIDALARCRREVKGRLSLSDVLTRIDDGRPGVEEAWAMIPRDEYGSVYWTDEMAKAFGVASPLLNEGDAIAARMAFKESYETAVRTARANKTRVKWWMSNGFDVQGRAAAIRIAQDKGRLTANEAAGMLEHLGIYSEPTIKLEQLYDNLENRLLGDG